MENLKTILGIALAITIGWHIKVGFSDNIKIAGIFTAKPQYGYNWENISSNIGGLGIDFSINEESKFPDIKAVTLGSPAQVNGLQPNDFIIKINGASTENWSSQQILDAIAGEIGTNCNLTIWRDSKEFEVNFTRSRITALDNNIRLNDAYNPTTHYFWEDNKVMWCTGFVHPKFNVYAGETKNEWKPLAGYVFINEKKGDLTTTWKSGLKHPDMNAYSTNDEGKWIPSLGYKFVMENDIAVNTTWDAGRQYDSFKIIAGQEQDTYYPYSGYQFVDPKISLEVVWTPGLSDPNNPDVVAGLTEGSWENRNQEIVSTEPTAGDHIGNAIVGGLTGKVIEWIFGENMVSNKIYEESTKEGIKGVIKSIK
jgi:hypothetical protein